jgi:hypothetical protein
MLNFSVEDPKYLIVKIDELYELMIVLDPLEYRAPNASSKDIIEQTKLVVPALFLYQNI